MFHVRFGFNFLKCLKYVKYDSIEISQSSYKFLVELFYFETVHDENTCLQTCQADLIKDGGHQYFLRALQDPQMSIKHRTMAAFVLAELVKGNLQGKEACLQRNIISICLDQLDNGAVLEHSQASQLKQWVAICLGE